MLSNDKDEVLNSAINKLHCFYTDIKDEDYKVIYGLDSFAVEFFADSEYCNSIESLERIAVAFYRVYIDDDNLLDYAAKLRYDNHVIASLKKSSIPSFKTFLRESFSNDILLSTFIALGSDNEIIVKARISDIYDDLCVVLSDYVAFKEFYLCQCTKEEKSKLKEYYEI